MTNEDVPPDVHDVLWTAYRDAGGNMDAGAVTLAREVVRLRAKFQAVRDGIAKIIMHTGRLPNASPDFLAALGGDDE